MLFEKKGRSDYLPFLYQCTLELKEIQEAACNNTCRRMLFDCWVEGDLCPLLLTLSIMETVWKQIGQTGHYVSNTGMIRTKKGNELSSFGIDSAGYYNVRIDKKVVNVHKLVAMVFLGFVPCGRKLVIHHKDGNKLNNHVDNLEIITFRENCSKERTLKASSKYPGVFKCSKDKWFSTIWINGKRKYVGSFSNEEDAYNAYLSVIHDLM